jgi:cell division protein FtsN
MIVLSLGQGDTTALSQTFTPEHIAEAGIYASWEEVLSAREAANVAGFGSISHQLEDGTYALEYVFKGTKKTATSQLERLNEVLGENLELFVPPTKTLPEKTATTSGTRNENQKQGIAINVSANFEKIPLESISQESPTRNNQDSSEDITEFTNALNKESAPSTSSKELDLEQPQTATEESTRLSEAETNAPKPEGKGENLVSSRESMSTPSQTKIIKDKSTLIKKEASQQPSNDSETQPHKTNEEPLYAIVFGSFKNKRNAIIKRDALIEQGFEAKIFEYENYHRVGIEYEEYPAKALRNFKKEGIQCWLLRND